MPNWEIPFESMSIALEATRGTVITPPTHRLNVAGTMTPIIDYYRPDDQLGTLEEYERATGVRKYGKWEAEGGLDPKTLPLLLNMAVKPLTSPSTPTNGVSTRLWEFVPTVTSDDLKSATSYWGDPNMANILQGAYTMIDNIEIESDASGTDGATVSFEGTSRFPTGVTPPAIPAIAVGPLLMPARMQVWIDVASAIGTTAITGRVVSARHSIPTGVTYKYPATGPTGGDTFDHTGRKKRHVETKIVMEVPDLTQFNNFKNSDIIKLRVRHNGPLIESVTPDYYYYVEVDTYGPFDAFEWGELEDSNRTIEVTVMSQRNATLGASFRIAVQNTNTAL